MTSEPTVDRALKTARKVVKRLPGDQRSLGFLVAAVIEFQRVSFQVPNEPDADGILFQYGPVNWFDQPTFSLGFARQLAVLDEDGEHDSYTQIQLDLNFDLDDELKDAPSRSSWWFRGQEELAFEDWLREMLADPVARLLESRLARDFELSEDQV